MGMVDALTVRLEIGDEKFDRAQAQLEEVCAILGDAAQELVDIATSEDPRTDKRFFELCSLAINGLFETRSTLRRGPLPKAGTS